MRRWTTCIILVYVAALDRNSHGHVVDLCFYLKGGIGQNVVSLVHVEDKPFTCSDQKYLTVACGTSSMMIPFEYQTVGRNHEFSPVAHCVDLSCLASRPEVIAQLVLGVEVAACKHI